MDKLPPGDVLIHAGDFTRRGTVDEVRKFNSFLKSLTNIKEKVVIAGNHEIPFSPSVHRMLAEFSTDEYQK